jgi:hypothetical protein
LVEENVNILSDEGRREAADRLAPSIAEAPPSGAGAVKQSQDFSGYQQAESLPVGSQVDQLKVVGDRSFVLRDSVWIDSGYQEDMATTKVGFGSDDYYQMLAQRADWGSFFALGERVIFLSDGQAYEVTEGDFPAVDAPDEPPTQPDTPLIVQPGAEDGDGFPVVPVAAGVAAAAAVLTAGAGVWYARRRVRA